jgi:hypothetical protein
VQTGNKEESVEFRDSSLPGYETGSRGIELSWQLQNNGKRGIILKILFSDSEQDIDYTE